ncbi:hypothetical protein AAGW05_06835 [Arthrobacter sp. LAPM80]|uniref:hypothetical protein n=1 Tax=Arthrobacter sp. LAPM80 TaxID=3141788 RepID=UPI00398A9DE6
MTIENARGVELQERIPHEMLADEPSMAALAAQAIEAAGPGHRADPDSVLAGIRRMATTQIRHWFAALHRPAEAEHIERIVAREDFHEQALWDHLTGDPGKISVHNQLAQLLTSELARQILVGSIRQGNHNPQQPAR